MCALGDDIQLDNSNRQMFICCCCYQICRVNLVTDKEKEKGNRNSAKVNFIDS